MVDGVISGRRLDRADRESLLRFLIVPDDGGGVGLVYGYFDDVFDDCIVAEIDCGGDEAAALLRVYGGSYDAWHSRFHRHRSVKSFDSDEAVRAMMAEWRSGWAIEGCEFEGMDEAALDDECMERAVVAVADAADEAHRSFQMAVFAA